MKRSMMVGALVALVGCGGGSSASFDISGDIEAHVDLAGTSAELGSVDFGSDEWSVFISSPTSTYEAATYDVVSGRGEVTIAHTTASGDEAFLLVSGDPNSKCTVTFDAPSSHATSGTFSCTGLESKMGHVINVTNGVFDAEVKSGTASPNNHSALGIIWDIGWLGS